MMSNKQDMESGDIDDNLYSRQRYVLGDHAMHSLSKSRVFLSGLGGLGTEIAKNVALAGVGALTLHDSRTIKPVDYELQFFLKHDDGGVTSMPKTRALASLEAIAALNPYVKVTVSEATLENGSDSSLDFLKDYDVVVLTEATLQTKLHVDAFCRSAGIRFICADVLGAFGMTFCDFGEEFEVLDPNGETEIEIVLSSISQDKQGVCQTLEGHMHHFEEGDVVEITEVVGCDGINGTQHKIHVLDAFRFSIGDTSAMSPYIHGGMARQVKVPISLSFLPLVQALSKPQFLEMDFSLIDRSAQLHVGFQALDLFYSKNGRFPIPWDKSEAENVLHLCSEVVARSGTELELDMEVLRKLSYTASGCLGAICATLAGVVGQEVLKAVTGKFTPLRQFLYIDAVDSVPQWSSANPAALPVERGDLTKICVGPQTMRLLADLNVFMVGAGAIGCEMLKNLALLGVSCGDGKCKTTVTDHDNIEMSNLNRQFLFRREDIQKSKAETAIAAVRRMQPKFKAEAMLHKVEGATEHVFTDEFFVAQDVVINALDNVEAREYVDGRCVSNQRALLESGTMGTKGHVQVIVPRLTESYTSQSDPQQTDTPFCTIKNFPGKIEHAILWARDKFESLFSLKPAEVVKFIEEELDAELDMDSSSAKYYRIYRLLLRRPHTFDDCVSFARQKFEKMFNHSIRQLLHSFPLDLKLSDGVTPYWTLPKRPPTPIDFSAEDPLHLTFIESVACLHASSYSIPVPSDYRAAVLSALPKVVVPKFVPSSDKKIDDDESKTKEEVSASTKDGKEVDINVLKTILSDLTSEIKANELKAIIPVEFEKDDDTNHHIETITAAANLRARNYGISETDSTKVKLVAGRIVPAIATTTSVVSGLVTLELIKLVGHPERQTSLSIYRNAFVNLALPIFALSEPGAVVEHKISETTSFTLWDRWEVSASGSGATLKEFIETCKTRYGLDVDSVFRKTNAIFMNNFPGHKRRLKKKMADLLKHTTHKSPYYDLIVMFRDPNTGEEVDTPVVRYFV